MAQQLMEQIRQRVLGGELAAGERLPPTRGLADELVIARNTIIQVYEQLVAEGYLESRMGSGTFVADLKAARPARQPARHSNGAVNVQLMGSRSNMISFNAGNPDAQVFPKVQWARLLKEACLDAPESLFGYGASAGEWRLRSSISQYLFRSKGIACQPEDVLIIPGAARGVEMLIGLLGQGIKTAVLEDPCIDFVQFIFRQNGYRICPLPVDQNGAMTEELPKDCAVSLIYVVPSHQFPTGGVLPISRRLQLLDYARNANAYIIEDDYDSEFRYQGEPIQSLRHLDAERVIYLGTFSKIFSPALRMGYMIVPSHLRERLYALMEDTNLRTSVLEQQAMASFIDGKLLDRHVYHMKKIYEKKRKHIINTLLSAFGNAITVTGANAGLHVLVTFQQRIFNPSDFAEFQKNGIEVDWVEDYAIVKGQHRNQLVLGYGNLGIDDITTGVQRLKSVVEKTGRAT